MAETLTCHVWMPIQVQLQAEEGAEGAAAAVVAGRWCAPALRRPLFPGRLSRRVITRRLLSAGTLECYM